MTATEFWPLFAAPLLNGIALLLALGFRRNRAVIMLAVLTFSSIALAGMAPESTDRGEDAARMFAPWLLLAAAALPERRLLARRNLILLLLLAIAVWLTAAAPAHVWQGLGSALPFGLLPWSAGAIAAGLAFIAAALCLLRWVLHGAPMEVGLCLVLILVGLALLPAMHLQAVRYAFALAGAGALSTILYASYRMAFVDALAGLPNRRALDEALARVSGGYALAMVDVDHFKRFNDVHGHDAGDRVLQSVAQQLRNTRGGGAYRYGGEEFCLLFTGARTALATQACEEVRERVQNMRVRVRSAPAKPRRGQVATKRADPSEVKVTVSIGLAERDDKTRTSAEVLKAADQALYKAKSNGRNCVVVHRSRAR